MIKSVKIEAIGQAKIIFTYLKEKVSQQQEKGIKKSKEIQLMNSIRQKVSFMKSNPFYGTQIEKKKIPEEYQVNNLWRVKLSNHWRMLYTIKGDQIEIICFVIEIFNHKEYNKKFRYKK